jgi:hypothetical protein
MTLRCAICGLTLRACLRRTRRDERRRFRLARIARRAAR